jgi:hypothetical protein
MRYTMQRRARPGQLRGMAVTMLFAALALVPAFAQQLPNAKLTPGVTTDAVTQQLCSSKFHTRDVRLVTTAMKRQVFTGYGIKCSPVMTAKAAGVKACSAFEVDHLISLELGGANDVKNLWPQPIAEARHKDVLENWLHAQVCSGDIALKDAQHRIATNWVAEYRRMEQSGKFQEETNDQSLSMCCAHAVHLRNRIHLHRLRRKEAGNAWRAGCDHSR